MNALKSLVVVGCLLGLLALVSCQGAIEGTVEGFNASGQRAMLVDADSDGIADVDGEGEVIVVENSAEIIAVGEKVDTLLPAGLDIAAAFGIPFVGLIASVIRQRKLVRVLANTVMSVQSARAAVQERGVGEVLKIVDSALVGSQTGETIAYLKKIKTDLGVASVTGS